MASQVAPAPSVGLPSLPEVHGSIAVSRSGNPLRRLLAFVGPGYLVAVGYMDPGNWATDLAGGSAFGYTLLSVILLSNLMAILLQALCGPARASRPGAIWRRRAGITIRQAGQPGALGGCASWRSSPATWPR